MALRRWVCWRATYTDSGGEVGSFSALKSRSTTIRGLKSAQRPDSRIGFGITAVYAQTHTLRRALPGVIGAEQGKRRLGEVSWWRERDPLVGGVLVHRASRDGEDAYVRRRALASLPMKVVVVRSARPRFERRRPGAQQRLIGIDL